MIAAPRHRTEPIGQPETRGPFWIGGYFTPAPEGALVGIGVRGAGAESRTQIFADEDLLTRVLLATDPLSCVAVEVTPAPRALSAIVFGVIGWDAATTLGIVSSSEADTILYGCAAIPRAVGAHELYRYVLTSNFFGGSFVHTSPSLAAPASSQVSPSLAAPASSQIMPSVVDSPSLLPQDGEPETRNRAVDAVRDLQEWLGLSIEGIAQMAGTSKSSILYWKREDAEPRPSIYHRLMRLHSLVNALRRGRSEHEFQTLIHEPLSSGSRLFDLLMAGDYMRAEDTARTVLFPASARKGRWKSRTIDLPEREVFVDADGRNSGRTPAKRTRRIAPRRSG